MTRRPKRSFPRENIEQSASDAGTNLQIKVWLSGNT